MPSQWKQTPHGEWVREGVGVVLGIQDRLWFAYPSYDSGRLGPFRSREEAADALEASWRYPQQRAVDAGGRVC
jgi:hypothetical protein